ncbi:MAG TPA: GGDEF domain-containing protein [Pseudonocardiaceae bacterium]|nr:GGDEF domain-containing protein [Pseudonocardiaceae bacterium]
MTGPRGWGLWSLPGRLITFVLGVESIAVLLIVLAAVHPAVTRPDWVRFAVLTACAIVHIELSRGVDRARRINSATAPWLDTKAVWSFAAVLIFPVVLAFAMVVLTHVWAALRGQRGRRPPYRWVFTTASVVIATQSAAAVLAVGPGVHPGVPTTVLGLAVVLAAAALRWFINFVLVVAAIVISSPNARPSEIFHNIGERILEVGSVGLGIAAAGIVIYNPILIVGILLGLIAMHRAILLPQYRKAASTDQKTGLHTGAWWQEIAGRAMDKAVAGGTNLAVLMLDLDYLKQVNDKHGHLAGDVVLQQVARSVSTQVGAGVEVGRWGGDEFVAFVPDADPGTVAAIAERLRRCVNALVIDVMTNDGPATVTDLTVSIGISAYPSSGVRSLDGLLLAADAALYRAKTQGRDQICFAPVPA